MPTRDGTLQWNQRRSGVTCDGVLRASPEDLASWTGNPQLQGSLRSHPTNPQHVEVDRWWLAQATHYGMSVNFTNSKTIRNNFRQALRAGTLKVAAAARVLESAHSMSATKLNPTAPNFAPNLPTQEREPSGPVKTEAEEVEVEIEDAAEDDLVESPVMQVKPIPRVRMPSAAKEQLHQQERVLPNPLKRKADDCLA